MEKGYNMSLEQISAIDAQLEEMKTAVRVVIEGVRRKVT
jgi:hypothetical protein